ncbi:MAG: Rrf2 family transcriptional regulator, partial [Chromatiales bacterium]|nr:Rrf2 family transcriptional regulator [Chromatiales bacterium]
GTHSERLVTIGEIAASYGISRNHLVKVVHHLGGAGFVYTTRGKGGGVRLMARPEEINLGQVIRTTEGGFDLVECMNSSTNTCPITQMCLLQGVVCEALSAFTAVWDSYTLADILQNRAQLAQVLVPLARVRRVIRVE